MIVKKLVLFVFLIITTWQIVVRCTCGQVFWEPECIAAGCFWKNDICIQVECENRVSKSECQQTTLTSDWNPNCKWIGDENGKCYDIDDYSCSKCENMQICEKLEDESCEIKYEIDRLECGDFSSNNCSRQLSAYEFCEKHDHCSSINFETKCNEILTEKACIGLGCYWDSKNTKFKCNPKDCIYFDQPNCLWTINSNRTFTFCGWNETRGFCQEQNETNIFTNIQRCSLDSNFTYHFDNTTGNQECQACVDPAELSFENIIQKSMIIIITLIFE